jgi:uncharacterized protein YeaO (DUF488 family)
MIKTKSIYDKIEVHDGQRILVSCYWPKHSSEKIVDLWLPELGSDLELIKNWQGRKYNWEYFRDNYMQRLERRHIKNLLEQIADLAREKNVTLVGHPRSSDQCHRSLLKEHIDEHYIYAQTKKHLSVHSGDGGGI